MNQESLEARLEKLTEYFEAKIKELERRLDLLQTQKTITQRNLDELY